MVPVEWDLFKITVEGRVSPASCAWEKGSPRFCAYPVKKGSEPKPELLSEMLRSGTPIPNEIRNWLADMIDPQGVGDFQFKKLSKRRRGAKIAGPTANWDAAEFVLQCISERETRQRAIGKAMKKFKIKRTATEQALKSYKEALAKFREIEHAYMAQSE